MPRRVHPQRGEVQLVGAVGKISCPSGTIFDYKKFRELPPEARLKLVREHGLCKLCLGRCDPGGKRLPKECRWRNQILHELHGKVVE
jgi:hypothetical protein